MRRPLIGNIVSILFRFGTQLLKLFLQLRDQSLQSHETLSLVGDDLIELLGEPLLMRERDL